MVVNLSKIIRTKRELAEDGKRSADHDRKMYEDDCTTDWERESNIRDDEDDDTFDDHIDQMIDWD